MKKIILVLSAISAISSFSTLAALNVFQPNESIRASKINENFSEIKTKINQRNGVVSFKHFQSGELITKEGLESEFEKVRLLGIEVPVLSPRIKSEELNNSFLSMDQGASVYNDIPKSSDLSFSTNEDVAYNGSFSVVNTIGPDSIVIETLPLFGVVSTNGKIFTYTPSLNYSGSDSIRYKAYDGLSYSESKTVSISILPINDAPTSSITSVTLSEDVPASFVIVGSDIDSSSLSYLIVSNPLYGTLSGTAPNLVYTPNLNSNGSDQLTFKVNDGELDSQVSTVSFFVNPINDVPVAIAQNLILNEDTTLNVTLSATDLEGDNLEYLIQSAPSNGTLSGTGANKIYTPALNFFGSDSFSFKVSDGKSESIPVVVSLNVVSVNDSPVIGTIFSIVVDMNSNAYSGSVPATDVDSTLSYSKTVNPSKGTLTVTTNSSSFTYQPSRNQYGADTFTITVSDGIVSIPVVYNVTITGSGIITANGTRTYYDGSVATSCNGYRNTSSGAKNYTRDTGSGVYNIQYNGSKPVISVYCDMVTDGGGWTFFPVSTYGVNTYVDWATSRTDPSKILVYLNNGSSFGYQILQQLSIYASTPIGIETNGTYNVVKFVPGVVQGKTNGMRYNGNVYSFTNSDSNANSYITFKNNSSADGNNLNVRVISFDLWATRIGISLPSYNMGWAGGGQYFGGGGNAISSNYFGYTWAMGVK